MEYGEQVVHHDDGAKEVGKVGVALGAVEERPEAVDLDETEAAKYRVVVKTQIEYVERYEAQAVHVELGRVHVVMPQPDRVGLQHALFEKAGAEAEHDVAHVQEVGQIVEREPEQAILGVDLVERVAVHDHPKVVDERQRDDRTYFVVVVVFSFIFVRLLILKIVVTLKY